MSHSLTALPRHVQQLILSYALIDAPSLFILSSVCREWRSELSNNTLLLRSAFLRAVNPHFVRAGYNGRWLDYVIKRWRYALMLCSYRPPESDAPLITAVWLATHIETYTQRADSDEARLKAMSCVLLERRLIPFVLRAVGDQRISKEAEFIQNIRLGIIDILPRWIACLWCQQPPDRIVGVYDNERDITSHYQCGRCKARLERLPSYMQSHSYFSQSRYAQNCRHCEAPLDDSEILARVHTCALCIAKRAKACVICNSEGAASHPACASCRAKIEQLPLGERLQ
jgi:hypothetical protein